MKNKILSIRNMEVKFQVRSRFLTAIRNVSLDVYDKEILAIVGESGSGKSVITKTFTGMLESNGWISDGSIIYSPNEESINDEKAFFKEPINLVNYQRIMMDKITKKNILKINNKEIKNLRTQIIEVHKYNSQLIEMEISKINSKIAQLKEKMGFTKSNAISYKIDQLENEIELQEEKKKIADNEEYRNNFIKKLNDKIDALQIDNSKARGMSLSTKYNLKKIIAKLTSISKVKENYDWKMIKYWFNHQLNQYKITFLEKLINLIAKSEVSNLNDSTLKLSKNDKYSLILNFKTAVIGDLVKKLAKDQNYDASGYISEQIAKLEAENVLISEKIVSDQDINMLASKVSFTEKDYLHYLKDYENKNYHFRIEKEVKTLFDSYIENQSFDIDHLNNLLTDWSKIKSSSYVNKMIAIKEMRKLRGKTIATIFQDPMTSLNPLLSVGFQISEVLRKQLGMNKKEAKLEAIELLRKVGISDPEKRYKDIPGRYSGGMRQRVVIAIALACRPKILICDEPTTALDVTIQAQILDLIKELQEEYKFTVIFITHDLGVVAKLANRIAVMYAGQIIEYGTTEDIFYDPKHPYTWALLSSLPQLGKKGEELYSIQGTPPSLFGKLKGDAFAPRNDYAMEVDFQYEPPMFKVSETHYAKTWLLDQRAPKITKPDVIDNLQKKITE